MDITIHLSDEQREKLSYIEKNSDLDVESLLTHAINEQYEKLKPEKPNYLEILRNSGFIGCSAGERELSTNYKAILAKEWSYCQDFSIYRWNENKTFENLFLEYP